MAASGLEESADDQSSIERREKRRIIRLLREAIDDDNLSEVQNILIRDKDLDVDFRYCGQTSLQLAVRLGTYDICRLLLERGANVNETDVQSNSILNMACSLGNEKIVQLLIDYKADLESRNNSGATPLHACAKDGYIAIMKLLLSAKCNLNAVDHLGRTAIWVAARAGQRDAVAELASAGCDVNWADYHLKSPLLVAAKMGLMEILQILIEAGANVNVKDREGRTALLLAAMCNHFGIVKILLEGQANPDLPAIVVTTPLLEAVNHQNMGIVKLLLESGCNINLADRWRQAPLHAAIRQVSKYFDPAANEEVLSLVKQLVMAGSDINQADDHGWTPLYQAAFIGCLELTKLLVESGADIAVLTTTKESIMHAAVYGNNLEVVHYLISAGCNLTMENRERKSPLYLACQKGDEFMVSKLLDTMPRPLVFKPFSANPVHIAAKEGYAQILQLLAYAGCNINELNIDGKTPLQVTMNENHFPAARRLLQLGCDPNAHAEARLPLMCCMSHDEPHPHLDNEPLFLALTHHNIELVSILLQCYHVVPVHMANMLKTIITSSPDPAIHFDDAVKRRLAAIFDAHFTQPRSLQEIARSVLRAHMGFPIAVKVEKLPLAKKQKEFVCLHDVFHVWDMIDRQQEEQRERRGLFGWRRGDMN